MGGLAGVSHGHIMSLGSRNILKLFVSYFIRSHRDCRSLKRTYYRRILEVAYSSECPVRIRLTRPTPRPQGTMKTRRSANRTFPKAAKTSEHRHRTSANRPLYLPETVTGLEWSSRTAALAVVSRYSLIALTILSELV